MSERLSDPPRWSFRRIFGFLAMSSVLAERPTAVTVVDSSASDEMPTEDGRHLPTLAERKVDFVMHSAEARMVLPAAEPVDIVDTVVKKANRQQS